MKSRIMMLVVSALMLVGMGSARAQSYGFDDLAEPDGTAVSTITIGTITVTMSNSSSNELTLRTYESTEWVAFSGHGAHNTPLNPSQVSYSRFISTVNDQNNTGFFNVAAPITFTFAEPVRGFGLTTLDLLESGAGAGAHVELTAFNEDGILIDQLRRDGPQGASGLDLRWAVCGDAISYVQLTGAVSSTQGGYGLDDLAIGCPPISIENSSWGLIKMLFR